MKKLKILMSLTAATALAAALAGSASADTMWNFSAMLPNASQNTMLGATQLFTQGGQTITATALASGWTLSTCVPSLQQPCLYDKYIGGDPSETGLGLFPNPRTEGEIYNPNGVGLVSTGGVISSISLGSIQTGESWQLQGCGAGFSGCTTLAQGLSGGNQILTGFGSYASYVVTVPCLRSSSCLGGTTNADNNIVLMSATTVPEPATLGLLALGLAGVGFAMRRRGTKVG